VESLYNLQPLCAEIFLVIVACCTLLLSTSKQEKYKEYCYCLSQIGLVGALLISGFLFFNPTQYALNHHYILDPLASTLKLFIYITTYAVLVYAKPYIEARDVPVGEYYALTLFSVIGMQVFVSGANFLTLYLGLEILSLPIYALVAIERNVPQRAEAAMKYFVMGAIASGLMLYGISLIYGFTQSLDFNTIAQKAAALQNLDQYVLFFSMVFIVAGLAFKLGVVPFHMWVPDVYQGAPTPVTAFITSAPKIAAMALVFRVLFQSFSELFFQWQLLITLFAVLSFALGNLAAIAQSNIKRMLAYSSIAHVGYLCLGLMTGTQNGYASALFYMITYTIASLGAFGLICVLSQKGIDLEKIQDFQGLNTRNPWLAFMMLLLMFSMGGIPPFVGFIAKLNIFQELIATQHTWLAAVALIFSVIGSYYYIRVVKVMYFEEPIAQTVPLILPGLESRIFVGMNALAVLFLGLFPGVFINLCQSVF